MAKIRWLHAHHFEKLVIIANAVNFILPLAWVGIFNWIVYSPHDSLMSFVLLGLASVIFAFSFYLDYSQKNMLFNLGLLIALLPLHLFVGIFTYYHIALAIFNIIAIYVMLKNKGKRKILPRFKSKFGKIGLVILIMTLLVPVGFYFLLPFAPIRAVVPDNSATNLEINWTWSENWTLTQEELDALEYCNNLSNINVSVTIALPEDYMMDRFNSIVINETEKLNNKSISVDFMPLLPEAEYGRDGLYINDITIDDYMQTIQIYDDWISNNSLDSLFRASIMNTELYWERRTELIFEWWDYQTHYSGTEKLISAVNTMKDIGNGSHPVICATFGVHLDDFIDFDDAQLQLSKLSVFPPWNWDKVGVMIYEVGPGSEFSIWSSCNAISYFFGDAGVPYIISMDETYDRILTKLKIIKNKGFTYCGCWALSDFLYTKNFTTNEKIAPRYTAAQFRTLHDAINNHSGEVAVYYQTFDFTAMHFLLQFLDIWLFNRFIYDANWPKIGNPL